MVRLLTQHFLILVALHALAVAITPEQLDKIERAGELTNQLMNTLANGDFRDSLTKFGKTMGPYLGSISPFIGLVFSFISTESEEVRWLKAIYKQIDVKFEQTFLKLDEIKRMIEKAKINIRFGRHEENVKSVFRALSKIGTARESSLNDIRDEFIRKYEAYYHDAGGKFVDAIVNDNHLFGNNIPGAVTPR